MSERPKSHIDAPKGHKPPKALWETPKRDLDGFIIGNEYEIKAEIEAKMERLTKDAKQPKPTLKEKAMNAILNQLFAFFKTWLYGRPVYRTVTNPDTGQVEFVLDDDGKKIMNVPATILARVMQVLGALGLLTSVVWGKTVAEWSELVRSLLAIFGL